MLLFMNIRFYKIIILNFLVIFFSCEKKMDEEIVNYDYLFNKIKSNVSGIDFNNSLKFSEDLNIIEYLYFYNGGGVAVGDINNDGFEDLYLSSNQGKDKLFINLGDFKFKDISNSAGLDTLNTWSTGVSMADVNGDGWLDIHVSKVGNYKTLKGHNLMYINQKDGTFNELSEELGIDFSGFSTQAAFLDYDNDGDLDMYLLNHNIHTPRNYTDVSKRSEKDSLSGDKFFENKINEQEAKFVDVSESSGIFSSPLGYGLAITTADVNNDGWVDLYVGNDFHENDYIYINQKNKSFKEKSKDFLSHNSRFTMGVDIADMNNDKLLDIFTLDMMPFYRDIFLKSGGEDTDQVYKIKKSFGYEDQYARNNFHLNRGNSKFTDIALYNDTYSTDWSWSVLLEDFNNDGKNDIFISNGIYKRPNDLDYINYASDLDFRLFNENNEKKFYENLIDKMPTLKIPNILYLNKGDLEFQKMTHDAGMEKTYSNGAAYGDFDNDGDLDLIVNNINQQVSVLENITSNKSTNNFVKVSLVSYGSRFLSIGSRVDLYYGGKKITKQLNPVKGFQSSSSYNLNFGLGKSQIVDSLKIIWADGKKQTHYKVELNQINTFEKNDNLISDFATNKKSFNYEYFDTHTENITFDYERELLIPELLSTEGPAVVYEDFNGDSLKDLYVGGASYSPGKLYLMSKNGKFKKKNIPIFNFDNFYEDVDAAASDIDNDGDLDLYVVSGGSEFLEGDKRLSDRIYINDGNANFIEYPVKLPAYNGSTISFGDFNNDGFDDIFLGSRSIPGAYGLSPFSFILLNNKKGGFGILEQFRMGMITDSEWVDINNDNLLDLVIVGDWMPVTILINKGDETFSNMTAPLGLSKTYGMWNSISIDDLDNNGRKDLLLGNAGLNLKFKTNYQNPIEIFLDDFDNNGQVDPVILYPFDNYYVPFASKDKLDDQMPFLKKKFTSYNSFSKVKSYEDLFDVPRDSLIQIKKINELRSMVFLNKKDTFVSIPFPKEAQFSPIQDILVTSTGNNKNIYFIGNYMNFVNELGNSDSNSGGKFIGFDGENFGKFETLPIPNKLNTRKIIKTQPNEFIIFSNNQKSYKINY